MRVPIAIPQPGSRPFDVCGFGLNSVDLLTVVAEFPVSNSKQRLQRFARLPGGQTATAMVTCARLGWSARYVGSFGSDDLGRLSRESLVAEGVDVSAARTVDGAANQYAVILVDASCGERTVLWDRDPALYMPLTELPRDAVVSARLVLVDCHETAAAAEVAKSARGCGIPTFIDVERVRPGIGDLLQHIDVVIAAEEFPRALTGYDDQHQAIAAIAREYRSPIVCVTLGAEGSLAWCGGRFVRSAGFQIDCVDSTGAGDVFRGAFMAACLRSREPELEDVLAYANAAAALNCRALGARAGIPTHGEVDRLLAAQSPI
jgi:sugar/nucleoside kinase (ribokinase family)